TVAEVCESPQLKARGMVVSLPHPKAGTVTMMGVPIRLWDPPGAARTAPPLLGQHTDEVLTRLLRYPRAKVTKLRAAGVVGRGDRTPARGALRPPRPSAAPRFRDEESVGYRGAPPLDPARGRGGPRPGRGLGSGLNLRLYETRAARVIAVEPSPGLGRMASRRMAEARVPVDWVRGAGEAIPLSDGSGGNGGRTRP